MIYARALSIPRGNVSPRALLGFTVALVRGQQPERGRQHALRLLVRHLPAVRAFSQLPLSYAPLRPDHMPHANPSASGTWWTSPCASSWRSFSYSTAIARFSADLLHSHFPVNRSGSDAERRWLVEAMWLAGVPTCASADDRLCRRPAGQPRAAGTDHAPKIADSRRRPSGEPTKRPIWLTPPVNAPPAVLPADGQPLSRTIVEHMLGGHLGDVG